MEVTETNTLLVNPDIFHKSVSKIIYLFFYQKALKLPSSVAHLKY